MTSDVSDPNEEVLDDPQTYEQALESKESTAWLKTIQEELDSMDKNKVWELVELPEGLAVKDQGEKVCRLTKAIYGLKQSPRQWFFTFHKVITEYGFIPNLYDPCVYTQVSGGKFVILSLYVDDILLMRNDLDIVLRIKEWLKTQFDMKDMGEDSFILGIKIESDKKIKKLLLSQERYLDNLLKRFGVIGWKTIDFISRFINRQVYQRKLTPSSDEKRLKMQSIPYAQVVGSLTYAMLCTRSDLGFVVNLVSRYQSNPSALHWQAVKRILRYLLGTKDYKLTYQTDELVPIGYADSNYVGGPDDRKSTSGFVFTLPDAPISWGSKKQKCVVKTTMEAEFVSCSLASTKSCVDQRFLRRLEIELLGW
ncbi:hypothetical protein H6P81_006302 [Aristolochia fimbriata]|uniref:Reverse transcriptase Ty1/copia-type domain-containing protein n=1 Tax=Aristolochia fimbriata TaxID=158543 RepID=A0AAV7EX52_ARIFI|nr:hypothetical protein H6P81_006302 [Aristolochia fimbriata]